MSVPTPSSIGPRGLMQHRDANEKPVPTLADLVVQDHLAGLYYFLLRKVGPNDATDLAQEVLARLMKVPLTDTRNPAAYAYTVAANLAMDFHRKERSQGLKVRLDSPGAEQFLEGEPALQCDSPEGRAGFKQLLELLLAELPDRQRAILLLHEQHGYKYVEIAQLLHTSPKAVEKQLLKAREKLSDMMRELGFSWRMP